TPPTVTGIRPPSGPVAGGTKVTITGSGFTGATIVDFGSTSASFIVVSDRSIKATTPAESVGTVHVTVTTPDGTSATSTADQFTFTPPTVTGIRPPSAPASGGKTVTITGSGFTGATMVDFGSASASFIVISDTSIKAKTPAEAVGTVHVTVTTPDGTSATSTADQFTFTAAAVTGVSPRSGRADGGTVVALVGTGFSAVTAVDFGSTPASSFTIDSDTSITAISPAEAAGTIDITVTTPSGKSTTGRGDKFTFLVVPTVVRAVSPTSGPASGGTTVTITGTNFTGATIVYFGTVPARSFVVTTDNSITATSPAEASGKVDVMVTGPGGTSATRKADKFTFVTPPPPPTVTRLHPTSGSITGGTTVTITGTNFAGATAVKFGTTPASSFAVISARSISATSPPEKAGAVDVTVATPLGTSATSSADRFTFVPPPPVVTALSPSSGPATGGTNVTITGTNFTGATSILFGATAASSFTVHSSSSIAAEAPAAAPGPVDVTVTTSGGKSATGTMDQYTFLPAHPTVTGYIRDIRPLSKMRSARPEAARLELTKARLEGLEPPTF
ncbi:MAG TPA: IPT/TIG domain-containing protein, partial [Acidimicrobiales bacterium]|nr:IPT/TIG domain-containing protein [Acidimicrobiales bacterium]